MIRLSLQYYPDDLQVPGHRDFKRMRLAEIASALRTLKEMLTHVGERISDRILVQPAEFEDIQFLSAAEKRSILKKWTGFVKNGFAEHLFTEAIYNHLHLHCGYIAHYDKKGFYGTYWSAYARDLHRHAKTDGFVVRPIPLAFYSWKSFLTQFSIWREYADINNAMMYVLKEELELLVKDLIDEARSHFEADMKDSYQLFLIEKADLTAKVDSLRREADELETSLETLTDAVHSKALEQNYLGLFGEAVSLSKTNSQMALL